MSMVQKLQNAVMRVNKETGALEAPKKERKSYLILVVGNADSERDWQFIDGRDETATFLFEHIDDFDLLESHVMSEVQSPDRAVSIYTFLRFCMEEGQISQDVTDKFEMDVDLLVEQVQNDCRKSDGGYYTRKELDDLYDDELNQ